MLRHIGRNDFHLQALSAGCRRYPRRHLAYAEPGGQHPVLVEENAAVELLRRLRNVALNQNDAGDQGVRLLSLYPRELLRIVAVDKQQGFVKRHHIKRIKDLPPA